MLAHERRRLDGQQHAGLRDGAEAAVINAAQAHLAIQFIGAMQHERVAAVVRADDHLRALAGGKGGCFDPRAVDDLSRGFFGLQAFVDALADAVHGLLCVREVLFRRESVEALLRGQFDVDADAIGVASGLVDERLRGLGDGFEMDVTAEVMHLAELPRDLDDLLHGVVRAAHDAAAEEEALDVVALVEVERELHDLLRRETRSLHIAGAAVDAVMAVVEAGVG